MGGNYLKKKKNILLIYQNDSNMSDKYQELGDNLFGFEVFESVFKVINERGYGDQEQMFKAGVASAEAAVRRLREEYYESVSKAISE
jgi:hypothetical protein